MPGGSILPASDTLDKVTATQFYGFRDYRTHPFPSPVPDSYDDKLLSWQTGKLAGPLKVVREITADKKYILTKDRIDIDDETFKLEVSLP